MRKPIEEKIKKLIKRQAAEMASKKAAKQGVKSVPWVGWGTAVIFFGIDCANPTVTFGEAVQSNIPYYGVLYDAKKVYDKLKSVDVMVEAELTSTLYENGDRSIPPDVLEGR